MVIFLVSDGATHPDRCFADNLFCRMALVEEVLREFPRVKIVISSSWREHYSLDDMRDFFDVGMQDRVIDVTSIFERMKDLWPTYTTPEYERQWECELWMEKNPALWFSMAGPASRRRQDASWRSLGEPIQATMLADFASLATNGLPGSLPTAKTCSSPIRNLESCLTTRYRFAKC